MIFRESEWELPLLHCVLRVVFQPSRVELGEKGRVRVAHMFVG